MSLDRHYKFKNPPCIFEVLDDEVVVINMERGHYYNLRGAGKLIFVSLMSGLKPKALCEANHWNEGTLTLVRDLIESLTREEIFEGSNPIPQDPEASAIIPIKNAAEEIHLYVYTDMEEILGLDPIHEIDSTKGWPSKP